MDSLYLYIYYIICIIHIQSITALPKQNKTVPESHVTEVSTTVDEDVKKVNLNSDPASIENTKALYYLLKDDLLNDNFLDRLVEKLTLIHPKPLPKMIPYANNDTKKPTRRFEWLDKAKFAIKSMPKYGKFIKDELASDYNELARVLFGINTEAPSHSNNVSITPTEDYSKTELINNKTKDIKLEPARSGEINTSPVNLNNETESTKPQSISKQQIANRRFGVAEEEDNNSQESIKDEILNDSNSDDGFLYENDDLPKNEHCESDLIYNNRRLGNIREDEIPVASVEASDYFIKNETNTTDLEPIPPIIKLLKNAWAKVMAAEANKQASKNTVSDENIEELNLEYANQKLNQTVSTVEEVVNKTVDESAMKQNRRTLSETAELVDEDKPNSSLEATNLWCSTGLLCRKTGLPVCGLDTFMGYARFEDICHLLLVNCYYKHQFIPVESCDQIISSEAPKL